MYYYITKIKHIQIMKTKTIILSVLAFLFLSISGISQTEKELYEQGLKYKKQVNNKKMLVTFKKLVDLKPNNVDYLSNLSFAFSKVGANLDDASTQKKYYAKAKEIATKAKELDDNNAFAHYSYALALARENENAGSKQKISNAKEIQTECNKTLALDPNEAGAYHIMGRWHRTFAGFGKTKTALVNTFFGGKPEGGTYADAVTNLKKAIKLEPWYMLHTYELAVTYHEMGKDDLAKEFVLKAMKLPQSYTDAKKCYVKCEALLAKLK